MVKKPIKYSVVDTFTDSPFKGNPAAVCFLEEEEEEERDEEWLQAVAKEFNTPITCYLTPITDTQSDTDSRPRFRIRWFTPVAEVKLCGHGTLAASHVLFTSGLVRGNIIEFLTLSGILTTKKVAGVGKLDASRFSNGATDEDFLIELNFPTVAVVECDPTEIPSIPRTLNGASMINIKRTATECDLIVELSSGEAVVDLQPQFEEIKNCPGRAVFVTGIAPSGSGFDFFSRVFGPKLGVNEDHVCGSAHCSLAPYWSKKLGKCDLIAYMASPRGGILNLHLDKETQGVLIRGKAVTVMEEDNCKFTPLYPEAHMPVGIPFQKGLGQKFCQPSGTGIDLGFFELDDLSKPSPKEDVFPLVIFAEACLPPLPTDEQLGKPQPTSSHAQITQAILKKKNGDPFQVKVIKQILWVDGVRYELRDIYGIGSSAEASFNDSEPEKMYVICMSEPKDTAVMPCRHMVELSSGETVVGLQPQFDEIKTCPGRGVFVTGVAPSGSGFDFFSCLFSPKLGVNEASPRGGILRLHLDKENQRVLI